MDQLDVFQQCKASSTLFLFEEFVSLEYHQQLSPGVQNKRTGASFFSSGKTKSWKQAAAPMEVIASSDTPLGV
jgi:hypothetical protein